jgi:HK97 family phage portal protein
VTLRERLKSTFSDGYLFNGEHRDLPDEVRRRAHSPVPVKSASLLDRLSSAFNAFKSVPFGGAGASNSPVVIYPNMNAWQNAISAALSGGTQPSDDPQLSPLVAAGYTWLGSTLPEPDLQVRKEFLRKRGGKKQDDNVIERHPIYQLLKRPNPYASGSTLWKAFAYSWIINGNAYWLKVRNRFGQVVELWNEPYMTIQARWVNDRNGEYIPADRSQSVPAIERNDSPTAFINYYELTRDGQKYRVEPADVVHFRDGEDPYNRRYGLSKMTKIRREIYGDSAVASYSVNLLSGSGVIPYVVGIDDKDGLLSQEDLDNIKAKLEERTTGRNAGKGTVLTARASFNRTGLTPAELDLRASRAMAQDVFSQVTGIPAIVLNFSSGMERSIYNNMSEADRRAIEAYLQPLWWHIAQELTNQLLPEFDQDSSHFMEFDLSEVGALQENENERVDRTIRKYEGGVITRAEARTELDYEADADGADDVYFVRSGSSTMSIEEEEEMRMQALEPPEPPVIEGESVEDEPKKLALVKSRMLKGAPETVKQLYKAN